MNCRNQPVVGLIAGIIARLYLPGHHHHHAYCLPTMAVGSYRGEQATFDGQDERTRGERGTHGGWCRICLQVAG